MTKAISVLRFEERRCNFLQNLWGHDPNMPTDVEQVWFPGVHCDVGGGYTENEAGLSKLALKWMVGQAERFGVRFNPEAKAIVIPEQDTQDYAAARASAVQHESLQGWWWIAEFVPKSIKDPANDFKPRWIVPRGRYRHVLENSKIHGSIFERMKNNRPAYKPTNLPKLFDTVS